MVRRTEKKPVALASLQTKQQQNWLGDTSNDKSLSSSSPSSSSDNICSPRGIMTNKAFERSTRSSHQGLRTTTLAETNRRKPRKQQNTKQRDLRFWKDVYNLQAFERPLMPRLPFSLLVRELIYSHSNELSRITSSALEALQMATEMYITQIMQDAYLLTLHRGRITLNVQDLVLIRVLQSHLQ